MSTTGSIGEFFVELAKSLFHGEEGIATYGIGFAVLIAAVVFILWVLDN
jgi:hypothetical protein